MTEKSKKVLLCTAILCGIICIGLIVVVFVYFAKPIQKKTGYRVMLNAFPYEDGEWYYEYDYGYQETPERLFGERCEYVFYGKIVEFKPFATNTIVSIAGESTNSVYAYALIKVKVLKRIYGQMEKGEETYLVMPYSAQTEEEKEMVQEGTEGLFIPRMPTVEVSYHNSNKIVDAIGMVGEIDNRFCCQEELLPELKKIDSLEEARIFWEENELCSVSGGNE